jgi:aspartyl-tRNA synthetase
MFIALVNVSCAGIDYYSYVFQRKDIVQQLENIPFESVVTVSGIVCSRPPTQENLVCRNCAVCGRVVTSVAGAV